MVRLESKSLRADQVCASCQKVCDKNVRVGAFVRYLHRAEAICGNQSRPSLDKAFWGKRY